MRQNLYKTYLKTPKEPFFLSMSFLCAVCTWLTVMLIPHGPSNIFERGASDIGLQLIPSDIDLYQSISKIRGLN